MDINKRIAPFALKEYRSPVTDSGLQEIIMAIPGPDPRLLDDLARVAGGAVNIMSGLQEQIRNDIRTRMEEMAMRMDLVPRDDLDRALGMIEKLRARVDALETQIHKEKAPSKKTTQKKTGKTTASTSRKKKKA